MNEIRIHALIEAYLSGSLPEADRGSLEGALLGSPQARNLYWNLAATHADLREWGLGQFGMPDGTRPARADASWRRWLGSPAATAAAICVAVGSTLIAGAAWAIVPHQRTAIAIRLPVGNAGFEDDSAPATQPPEGCTLSEMLPGEGSWAADDVRIAGAEHGVTPREGRHMLCFERSLPAPGTQQGDQRSIVCDLFQFVDLRPLGREIAGGEAVLNLSARFCEAAEPRDYPVRFTVRLFIYDCPPLDVGARWPSSRVDAVAMQQTWVVPDQADGVWRSVAARAIVPPHARCALVHITASNQGAEDPAARLGRQYCDDVRLVLSVPTDSAAPASATNATQ